jgi:hypothetical protein
MNDIPFPPDPPDFRENLVSADSAALWPAYPNMAASHSGIHGFFRPQRELPIYCNPLVIFFAVWIIMLASLSFHVSYVIYPELGTPLLIFIVSAASLLLGFYACTTVLEQMEPKQQSTTFVLDLTALWRLNLLFCFLAMLLIAANWLAFGPPPAISDPSTYQTYGKLKQILFPMLTCVAVNATLDKSRLRRFLFITFALSALAVYVARGILLGAFLQMFFLFSLRSHANRKKQYLFLLGALAIGVAGMTVIGNLRTAHDIFIEYLEIRATYADWPMAFLWPVSYISIPFSNLCWMVARGSHGPMLSFLYLLLPSFMAPANPYADIHNSMNIIDGASTYLEAWALDFSYLGIYFANLLIGIGCGWMTARAYPRNALILAIFLTSMSLLFFSDLFFLLSIVVQILLQAFIQRRCIYWQQNENARASEFS